jgi:hypothetical protein
VCDVGDQVPAPCLDLRERLGHLVDMGGEFAQFVCGRDRDALPVAPRGDASRHQGHRFDGRRDPPGDEETHGRGGEASSDRRDAHGRIDRG